METDDDTAGIARVLLRHLEDAWNRGDGAGYAAPYLPDASFVTVRGEVLHDAQAIGAGHDGILRTIYAGSVNRMELIDARRVSGDVVVATSRHTLDAPDGPLRGVHQAVSTSVLVRSGAQWRIAATQNTMVGA